MLSSRLDVVRRTSHLPWLIAVLTVGCSGVPTDYQLRLPPPPTPPVIVGSGGGAATPDTTLQADTSFQMSQPPAPQ
jgi:hypothetical protein